MDADEDQELQLGCYYRQATYSDATGQSWSITDCTTGEGETCSAPEGQTIYDVDPVEGQFKLEGLEWGTYTLVETKAPDGYDVDSTERTFTFGPTAGTDGTGKWNSNGVESKDGDTTGGFTTSDVDYTSSVFTFTAGNIKNKPGGDFAGDWWSWRLLDLRGGFGGCVDRCCCGWNGPQGQEAAMMNSSRRRGTGP